MRIEVEKLKALLETEPVRGRPDNRSAVRRIMDENDKTFRVLAEKGHPHASVVDAFLADYPELRQSRLDLEDDEYREHVVNAFVSFKTTLGLGKKRNGASPQKRKHKPKKAVEERPEVKEEAAAHKPEPVSTPASMPKPGTESEKPAVVKPTDKGFRIPKAKDF